jgi:hypothetical protein
LGAISRAEGFEKLDSQKKGIFQVGAKDGMVVKEVRVNEKKYFVSAQ